MDASAQSAWEIAGIAGALNSGDDFATTPGGWGPLLGGRIAWRPAPTVSIGAEAWRATLVNDLAVTGGGLRMAVTPWAGRGWGLDPALVFGIERLAADDDEDRGVAFVSGAGVRKDAGAWTIQAEVLHRQLTVEEPAVEGVETARDATLWEARVALGWIAR